MYLTEWRPSIFGVPWTLSKASVYTASFEGWNAYGTKTSARRCGEGFANALGEIFAVPGSLGGFVDARTPPQFFKWQRCVQSACAIKIAIAPTVHDMADIKPADPAGEVSVAHDIDCAAVAEQMIKLGLVRKLVDPLEVDQKEPAHKFGGCSDMVEKNVLLAVIGANPHQIALIADDVDELELLEERVDGIETLPDFRPGFNGYTDGRSVIEDKTDEGVCHRRLRPKIGHVEIQRV